MMFSVAEINRPEQLSEYRLVWRSLQNRTRRPSFFHSREWLECYLRHWGADQRLRACMVFSDNRPVGMAPFVVKPCASRLGTVRVLTYPTEGWSAFFSPIGLNTAATLIGALQHLLRTPRDWDVIDLRGIDTEHEDRGRTDQALRVTGLSAVCRPWNDAADIELDDVDAGDQFRLRRELQSAERDLWQHGNWRIQQLAAEELSSAQQRAGLEMLEQAGPLLAERPEAEREFLTDLWETAAWTGNAEMSLLQIKNRPVAWSLAVRSDEALEPIAVICDPAYPNTGSVLVGRMLVEALQRSTKRMMFGPRVTSWASGWGARLRRSSRWTHFAAYGARAQLLRMAQWGQAAPVEMSNSSPQPTDVHGLSNAY